VCAGLYGFGDLGEMQVHRLGIASRQDQGRALAPFRADGAEDISGGGALIAGSARAGAALRPAAGDLVLLADPSLVLEPNLFSNRPFGVKRFQTIHHSVDVAHGLALLFGISTKALPAWDSRTRWNNLLSGLAVGLNGGPRDLTNSPHPSSREGHHSTAWWISNFLLSHFILHGSHAGSTSRLHRNSVPSTHMRCMITANRRASATIAFFIPRCLAIFIAQALSQDHLIVRVSMLWAAS
jgi:hypothetical protein